MNKFYKKIFKNTLSTLTAVIVCVLVVAGAAFAASTIGNNVSVGGTLAVTSGATFTTFASSTTALNTQGTLHVGSTSSFDGAATFLTSGTFTTFASSTTALNTQGTLHVGSTSSFDGTLTLAKGQTLGNATANNIFINSTGISMATSTATTTAGVWVGTQAGTATSSLMLGNGGQGSKGPKGACIEMWRENVAYRIFINAAGSDVVVQAGRCKD
jgi:hypothetical protein